MYDYLPRFARTTAILLVVLGVGACQKKSAPAPVTSIEIYQRWNRAEFLQNKHSTHWPPPRFALTALGANALAPILRPLTREVPPEYQRLWSLYLRLDHKNHAIDGEWRWRKRLQRASYRHNKRRLGARFYRSLVRALAKRYRCSASVKGGWAGAAPVILELHRGTKRESLYYSDSKRGFSGPGSDSQRYYLCSKPLRRALEAIRRQLNASP